jgi:hypothetical protein
VIDEQDAALSEFSWRLDAGGYALRNLGRSSPRGKTLLMHREILGLSHGDPRRVDHIDGNRLNNRRSNLRIATPGENQQNRRLNANNTSGYRGVMWDRINQKWRAKAQLNGRSYHLGEYDAVEEAAAAAAAFRAHHMPFSAN